MEKIFRIKGSFEKRKNEIEFTKEIEAKSEERAIDRLNSEIGSKHAVKRNLIHISEVEEIKPEEAENPKFRREAEVE